MRKFLKSSKVCLAFPGKWFCIRQPNSAFSSLESIFHGPGDSIYDFCQIQNKFTANVNIRRKVLEGLKLYFTFPEKRFCIRGPNLAS